MDETTFEVFSSGEKATLLLGRDEVRLSGGDAQEVFRWADIQKVSARDARSVMLTFSDRRPVQVAFSAQLDRDTFVALAENAQAVKRPEALPPASRQTVASAVGRPAGPSASGTVKPPITGGSRGSTEIWNYLRVGVGLQALAGLLIAFGLSHVNSTDYLTGATEISAGATFVIFLGWLSTLAGGFCILVGVIAKGVQIGNRAS
jgi:hypothetical protein